MFFKVAVFVPESIPHAKLLHQQACAMSLPGARRPRSQGRRRIQYNAETARIYSPGLAHVRKAAHGAKAGERRGRAEEYSTYSPGLARARLAPGRKAAAGAAAGAAPADTPPLLEKPPNGAVTTRTDAARGPKASGRQRAADSPQAQPAGPPAPRPGSRPKNGTPGRATRSPNQLRALRVRPRSAPMHTARLAEPAGPGGRVATDMPPAPLLDPELTRGPMKPARAASRGRLAQLAQHKRQTVDAEAPHPLGGSESRPRPATASRQRMLTLSTPKARAVASAGAVGVQVGSGHCANMERLEMLSRPIIRNPGARIMRHALVCGGLSWPSGSRCGACLGGRAPVTTRWL
jgi:hypothetical protein